MEQFRQRKHDRLELDPPSPIPAQRRTDPLASLEPLASPEPVIKPPPPGLSERDCAILTFEKQWWRHAGTKEAAIRDRFDLSGTRYYQILNALLDDPAALQQDPILVGRLRRIRGSRARARGR